MLEIKITLHGRTGAESIAAMHIIQSARFRGNDREYAVSCFRVDMQTQEIVRQVGTVERHDRTLPVWELVKKAIEALEPH